jgi:hypothetical protein
VTPEGAWSTGPAGTTLTATAPLFVGSDYDSGYWPAGSPLQIRVFADGNADLSLAMATDGVVSWPDGLTWTFVPVPGGGLAALNGTVALTAEVHYDLFGFNDTVSLWERVLVLSDSVSFDSLLLAGPGDGTLPLEFVAEKVGALDTTLTLVGGLALEVGGRVEPRFDGVVTGLWATVGDEIVTRQDAPTGLPLPTQSGEVSVPLGWSGKVDATLSMVVEPWLDLCLDDDCYEVASLPLAWTFGAEGAPLDAAPSTITLPLPALAAPVTLDLGSTTPGVAAEAALTIDAIGPLSVEGDLVIDGDGFSLVQPMFYAAPGNPGQAVVRFLGDAEGTWSGTLVLRSNDPVAPVTVVPVAVHVAPPVAAEEPTLGTQGLGAAQCGCNVTDSAPAFAGALVVSVLFAVVMGLRRRR